MSAKAWSGSRVRRARARIRRLGQIQQCWRCGRQLDLDVDTWHAGHLTDRIDGGGDLETAAECAPCNLRAGGQRGAAITNARRTERPTPTMTPERDRRIPGLHGLLSTLDSPRSPSAPLVRVVTAHTDPSGSE